MWSTFMQQELVGDDAAAPSAATPGFRRERPRFSTNVTGSARRATSAATSSKPNPPTTMTSARARRLREAHGVRQQRLAPDRDQRLGDPLRQRAEAAPEPRRQQHRLHGRPVYRVGEGELRSPEPVAGGFGNPFRVPMSVNNSGSAAKRRTTGTCGKREHEALGREGRRRPPRTAPPHARRSRRRAANRRRTASPAGRRRTRRDTASKCGRPLAQPAAEAQRQIERKVRGAREGLDVLHAVVRRDDDAHAHARAGARARGASPAGIRMRLQRAGLRDLEQVGGARVARIARDRSPPAAGERQTAGREVELAGQDAGRVVDPLPSPRWRSRPASACCR